MKIEIEIHEADVIIELLNKKVQGLEKKKECLPHQAKELERQIILILGICNKIQNTFFEEEGYEEVKK